VAAQPGRLAAWLDTWPGRITAIAGAIVAVIGVYAAIKSLLPSPDVKSRAAFGTVTITDGIRLSEYRARSEDQVASIHGRGPGAPGALAVIRPARVLLAQTQPATTTTDGTTTGETTTGTTTGETTTGETTTAGTTTTGAPTTKDGRRMPVLPDEPSVAAIAKERPAARTVKGVVLPDNATPESFRAKSEKVLDHAEDRADADTCSSPQRSGLPCDAILPIVAAASIGANGAPVSAQVAEDRLVDLLKNTRTVLIGGEHGKREPVGVEVTFLIELEGLRGEDVYIRWSIHEAGSKHRLFGKWLSTSVAYRLKVNSDDTTRARNIWVPLPETKGPFFVRLYVASEGDILSFYDTKRFR
jgi:hypothetical protein